MYEPTRLQRLAFAAAVAAGLAAPLALASRAEAGCDAPRRIYQFSKVRAGALLTNVRSAWADQGFTINYTETKTASVHASLSGTLELEAGAIFANASASLGISVGGTWSKASTWSYSATVPRGKEGRIVMYRESRRFAVTKKSLGATCAYVVRYRNKPVNAPLLRGDSYIFRMQLRPRGMRHLRASDDYFTEEIDLPSPPPRERAGEEPRRG